MNDINKLIVSPLKAVKTFIFNMKELFHHRISPLEISLIKNTRLFNSMSENTFKEMVKSVRLVKYKQGSVILREGEPGNELYIISKGYVRVYTQDMNETKIPLKTYTTGDYFGEQAIVGKVKVRNSNIEAMSDTTLILINGTYIAELLKIDSNLNTKLKSDKFKQALNIMSFSSGFHQDIESILSRIDKPTIMEFSNNEYIFKVGDKPDNVYIVLQGKVKLLVPDKQSGAFSKVLLNRGHIFGELGVIKDAPRAATAIAHSNLRLLAIDGNYFKEDVSQSPQFQQMLSTLQQIYQIPMRGTIEQYIGDVPGMGSAITNIYKLEDGRSIVSCKALKENVFTMSIANVLSEQHYEYATGENIIEIDVANYHLIGLKVHGACHNLPELCRLLMDNEHFDDAAIEQFVATGELKRRD